MGVFRIDPAGFETALWSPFLVSLPATATGLALSRGGISSASTSTVSGLATGTPIASSEVDRRLPELRPFPVSVPLPPVSPAFLGQLFRVQIRFDDPSTGAEQDRDSVKIVIQ